MLTKIFPTPGARVTFPRSRRVLPAEGQRVEIDTYWRRRIRDGACTLEPPAKEKKAKRVSSRAPQEE